uniref:Uncharacterized protein n=1 Tax=Anguilla anguilla TaxID=7936 RepID=A0A0E9V9J9_ANGAN
MSSARDQESGV